MRESNVTRYPSINNTLVSTATCGCYVRVQYYQYQRQHKHCVCCRFQMTTTSSITNHLLKQNAMPANVLLHHVMGPNLLRLLQLKLCSHSLHVSVASVPVVNANVLSMLRSCCLHLSLRLDGVTSMHSMHSMPSVPSKHTSCLHVDCQHHPLLQQLRWLDSLLNVNVPSMRVGNANALIVCVKQLKVVLQVCTAWKHLYLLLAGCIANLLDITMQV
jgi:hypothetical protein